MIEERSQALSYLRAPSNACWRWAENGAVLVWRDGATVAFREEIIAVLQRLAPAGLPPFPAIALLLAACRGKLPQVTEVIGQPRRSESPAQAALLKTARQQLTVQVEAMLAELAKLQSMPTELVTGLSAKSLLAEIVFEAAKVERQTNAEPVLAGIKAPFEEDELNGVQQSGWTVDQVAHLSIVARGLKPHSSETLRLRLLTGLDGLPGAAGVELTPAEQARRLLDELLRDQELAGLARAARQLMAAIRLPRRLTEEEHLAIGGVADVSNRGPLDRLLLSELAHDDLTLATRVALNEALYLRREPPTREPPSNLAILLDSGVRLWGVPRLFAVAVALALVARERHRGQVSVWRAERSEVRPVDLLSRRGLIAHLGQLETDPHPGAALEAFYRELADSQDAPGESVLITDVDTLRDPDFRRALASAAGGIQFIAAVDRSGAFQLHSLPLGRGQPLSKATLDLNALFAEPPATPLLDAARDPNLPLIFCLRPLPLLLPVPGKLESVWPTHEGEGGIAVTRDGRVLQWNGIQQGARQLATGIPRLGRTLWLHQDDHGDLWLLRRINKTNRVLLIHSQEKAAAPQCHEWISSNLVPVAIHQQQQFLLVIGFGATEVIDLTTRQVIARKSSPPRAWHQADRFFIQNSQWLFVHWDGQQIIWEPISFPEPIPMSEVVLVFDRHGFEGPLVLTQSGEVFDSRGERIFRAGHHVRWARASRDGHRLVIDGSSSQQYHLLDLRAKRVKSIRDLAHVLKLWRPAATREEPPLNPWPAMPACQVRRRFVAVHVREPGVLTLYSNRGTGLVITSRQEGLHVRAKEKSAARPAAARRFRPCPARPELGCQLMVAEWPNGSRVFLDSRGLLHLMSHDRTLPQMSLVLHEGDAAVWCSDGVTLGPQFFGSNPIAATVEKAQRFVCSTQFLRLMEGLW